MSVTPSKMLATMQSAFREAGLDNSDLEAKALLTGLLELSTLELITRDDLILSDNQIVQSHKAIQKRLAGCPVYRILGWREFYGLKFELSEETLEPRADTETLVEAIIPYVNVFQERQKDCRVVDLGTGTGAIALSILDHCKHAHAIGVDQSEGALATALRNSENLGLRDRFSILKSDWTSKLEGKFDVIVSNPPYIDQASMKALTIEVKEHDPALALFGGKDGLDAYRTLAEQLPDFMHCETILGLEIGFDQNESVQKIFKAKQFELIQASKDLSGHDRVLLFKLSMV